MTGAELIKARIEETQAEIEKLQNEILVWKGMLRDMEEPHNRAAIQERIQAGEPRFPTITSGIHNILEKAAAPMTSAEVVDALHELGEDRADIYNVGMSLRRAFNNGKMARIKEPGRKARYSLHKDAALKVVS